jgi:hypothetical protein
MEILFTWKTNNYTLQQMEMDYGNPIYLEDKQLHLAGHGCCMVRQRRITRRASQSQF